MKRRIELALLLIALPLAGCVESSMVARTRWQLEDGLPGASFERMHALKLGRISTALLKPLAKWALDDDSDELQMVRQIRRVDLAVYEVVSFPEEIDAGMLGAMERRMTGKGWDRVVRALEEDEITWVFNRETSDGEISDLFVVSVDGAEMVIVRVGGRLEQLLADLIAADPGGFGASLGG